jgi:hypothetical protein
MDAVRRIVISSVWTATPPWLRHSVRGLLRKTTPPKTLCQQNLAAANYFQSPDTVCYTQQYNKRFTKFDVATLDKCCSISGNPPRPAKDVRVKWSRSPKFKKKNIPKTVKAPALTCTRTKDACANAHETSSMILILKNLTEIFALWFSSRPYRIEPTVVSISTSILRTRPRGPRGTHRPFRRQDASRKGEPRN